MEPIEDCVSMRILIHLAHPAHYHLFKFVVPKLLKRHEVHISYNSKDVLEQLIDVEEVPAHWHKVRLSSPSNSKWAFLSQFIEKEVGFYRLAKSIDPDLLVGTPIILAHAGQLLHIPSIIVNEDDFDVIKSSTSIGYPFATVIVAPTSCSHGKWGRKTVHYNGYHELAYLRPEYFSPNRSIVEKYLGATERYFVLRFSSLSAHHDIGKTGLTTALALELIELLKQYGQVFVNAEKSLDASLEPYKLPVHPRDMHHILYYADLYIGDSQTMAAEAAVLGTPSIRYNDFVGQLGYLEELESSYNLTLGVRTGDTKRLLQVVQAIASNPEARTSWRLRADAMINEKIDVAEWLAGFIEGFSMNQSDPSSH